MKNFDRLERLIWENSCDISLPETSKQDAWKALVKRINFDTNLIEPIKGKKGKLRQYFKLAFRNTKT